MYNHDLIEDFLRPGNLVIIAGPPKVGKTAIASAMALAVAKGKPFARTETTQGAVLWLALEESPNERAEIMRAVRGRTRTPFYTSYRRIKPDTAAGMARLSHMCALLQPALIVVDPLFAAQSTRSNWQALENLRDLAQQIGAAVLVLHHLRAYNPRAEAGDLVKFASAVWSLDYTADGNNRLVTLRCEASQTRVPVTSDVGRPVRVPVTSVRQLPSSDTYRELVAETALRVPVTGDVGRPVRVPVTSVRQHPSSDASRELVAETALREPVTSDGGRPGRVPVTSVRQHPSSDASRELVAEATSRPTTIRLRSKSPLHYAPLPEANIFSCTAEVLSILEDHEALSSRQIASLAGIAHGSARNIIADLRRRGEVRIALKSARTIYYRLGSHTAH